MPAGTDRVFLGFSAKKLDQLSSRIAECVGKLKDDEVWARGHENENAIGNHSQTLANKEVAGHDDYRPCDRCDRGPRGLARQANTAEILCDYRV